jgi:hypothetical protein
MDPSMMDPKHYRVDYLRRRIRQHLFAVQTGLAGTDDFVPPRTTTGGPAPANPATATQKAAQEANATAEKRGVHAIAGAQQEAVKQVYYRVRRLAEIIEVAGNQADFFQLVKDMRQEMKPLELMTKRLPAPGAAGAIAAGDDAPSAPVIKGPAGKAGPGKANPVKSAPPPAPKGKTAIRMTPPRPQPAVMAKPRR